MVLEGDGQVVRGIESAGGTQLYMENVTLSSFARSFGSAIKVNNNVTMAMHSVVFKDNIIIPEQDGSGEKNHGPDLHVGSDSSALLNNVTFTALTEEESSSEGLQVQARMSVRNILSRVFSSSAGADGQDGATAGGQEVSAPVYVKEDDSVVFTEPVPAGLAATFPSLNDPWFLDIMQEWEQQVRAAPFIRTDGSDADTVLGGGAEQAAASELEEDGLVIEDAGGGMQVPTWAWIAGIVFVFLLLVGLLGLAIWCIRGRQFSRDVMFGSVPTTSASLKQANARSRALSGPLQDSYAASSDMPLRVSGPLVRSGLLVSETPQERSALMSGSLLGNSAGMRSASGPVNNLKPMATLGSDRLIAPIDTGRRPSGGGLNASSTLVTPKSLRSDNNNTQSMHLTPRSPCPDQQQRPSSTSQSVATLRPQTNNSTTSHRRTHTAGSVSDITCGGEQDGGPDPPVRSASTSSSMLENSVPVPTPTGSAGERSGAAGTPLTPYTDYTGSQPFKGTHDLSPMAGGMPGTNLAQWPQELEAALDNMKATSQAFLGRYDLQEGASRLRSPQGIVSFATCRVTQQKVALKFFFNSGHFLRDEALYQQSALRPLMQAVLSMHGNSQGAITYGPYTFPPCIVMMRGESLRAWIRSETRSFNQVCVVLLQLASWLEVAHKTGFAHRNLKPTNVIQLAGSSTVTVTDFGCAARIGTKIAMSKSIRYSPPEAVTAADQNHTTVPSDPAADIWSFGAITHELATGKSMFAGYHSAADVRAALGGQAPFPWEFAVGVNATGCFSRIGGLRRILKWCLCRDPAQRPTAHALVAEISNRMRAAENSGSATQFKGGRKK